MRARLKSLRSDEIDDLERFAPDPPDAFAVPLVLEVGVLGQRGRERFDLLVVTPRWLRERHGQHGAVLGGGKLIVFEWSYERIRRYLAKQVEACSGATWPEIAKQVARIAEWEGSDENVLGLR